MKAIENLSKKNIFRYLKISIFSVSIGLIFCFLSLLAFAFFITKFDIPESLVNMLPIFSGIIGAFVAGIVSGKAGKSKGIIFGLGCGLIIALIIIISTLLIFKGNFNTSLLFRLITIIVSGMIGGTLGVNSKK